MKVVLDQEEQLTLLHTILCDNDWSLSIGIATKSPLKRAVAEQLQAQKSTEVICREDVWVEMVKQGHSITLVDNEETEDNVELNLAKLNEGIEKMPIDLISKLMSEDGEYDAWTCYEALQYIMFGEVIFG